MMARKRDVSAYCCGAGRSASRGFSGQQRVLRRCLRAIRVKSALCETLLSGCQHGAGSASTLAVRNNVYG